MLARFTNQFMPESSLIFEIKKIPTMKPETKRRQTIRFLFPIQTRWADNDMYGHVNNVTYYSYFDTAANALLIQHAGFDSEIPRSLV